MIRPTIVSFTRSAALALACFFGSVGNASAADPIYDLNGFQPGRDYFSPLPYENIDTVTGNVVFTYTDFHLPGDAGFDLNIVRTYNSRDGKWHVGVAGAPTKVIFRAPTYDLSDVDLLMMDGSMLRANAGTNTTVTLSNFWRFNRTNGRVEMPNGRVAFYDLTVPGDGLYLTAMEDAYGNNISFEYYSGTTNLGRIWQHPVSGGAAYNRMVFFDIWVDGVPLGFNYNGHWWSYNWITVAGLRVLQSFDTPLGRAWSYTYSTDADGLAKVESVKTPNGGVVNYSWTTDNFAAATPSTRVVLGSRSTSGNVPSGTWNFDWQNGGTRLVVETPVNRITYDATPVDGKPMTGTATVAELWGTVMETETQTFDVLTGPSGPFVVPKTRTTTRGSRTYSITNNYSGNDYGDYGHPNEIVESGELNRTTSISYRHDFAGHYIRGVPTGVTVNAGSPSYSHSMTYGDDGFLTSVTQFGRTTTFSGSHGNVTDIVDANGRHTTMTYDMGVLKTYQSPEGVVTTPTINADSQVTTETIAGRVTTYAYDLLGRVTSATIAGTAPATTTYTSTGGNLVQITNARGSSSATTDLDGFGRAIHTVDAAGVQTRQAFDAVGRQTYSSYPYGGSVAEVGVTTAYTGGPMPYLITRPDGSTDYFLSLDSGRGLRKITRVSATESRVTETYIDSFGTFGDGHLVGFKDAAGVYWDYQYDGLGNLVRMYGPTGLLRTWNYDWRNLLVSETHPESGSTSYTYDNLGQVISRQDARGAAFAVGYTYDGDGRLTSVNAPGTADDVTTTYGAFGPITETNGTSRTTYSYDGIGRVTGRTDVIAGRTFSQTFAYDTSDRLVSHTYPITGRQVMYAYGAQDRVTSVSTQLGAGPVTTLASNFVYHPPATTASFQFGNGLTQSATFDARLRPTALTSGPLSQTAIGYDDVDNITSITDARPGFSSTYRYDALDRLTNVFGYAPTTITYDSFGNRLTKDGVTYHYDAGFHLTSLTGAATGSFTYDPIGNTVADAEGSTFTYTGLNLQKTATVFGTTTTYRYGADGLRNMKVTANSAEQFFIRSGSGLVGEYDAAGLDLIVKREYVYFGNTLLASFAPSPVTAPATSVAITNPTLGQVIPQAQSLNLTATATPASGLTVTRVEYYLDGLFIGQATTAPYTVPFINAIITPGLHTFLARVVTSDGRAVSSPPVNVTTQ